MPKVEYALLWERTFLADTSVHLTIFFSYSVYGCRKYASFAATCQISTHTKEALDEFKSKVSVGAKDVAEAVNELEASIKPTKSDISSQIDPYVIGYSASGGVLANTKEIPTSFEKFQPHAETVPFVALLQHYSAVDPAILPVGEEFSQSALALTREHICSKLW